MFNYVHSTQCFGVLKHIFPSTYYNKDPFSLAEYWKIIFRTHFSKIFKFFHHSNLEK